MSQLPDLPSELILVGMRDLSACMLDSRYVVNMLKWHVRVGDRCQVCLAGAVMAQSLGVPIDEDLKSVEAINEKFGSDTAKKLYALDSFRTMNVGSGLVELGYDDRKATMVQIAYHTWYDDDRVGRDDWTECMLNMSRILKENGC